MEEDMENKIEEFLAQAHRLGVAEANAQPKSGATEYAIKELKKITQNLSQTLEEARQEAAEGVERRFKDLIVEETAIAHKEGVPTSRLTSLHTKISNMSENKNTELTEDFYRYHKKHPEMRFWQALRNWSGATFILKSDNSFANECDCVERGITEDTFNFEGKKK